MRVWLTAALVAGLIFGLLAVLLGPVIAGYFPIADDWALLANSSLTAEHVRTWFTQGFAEYFVEYPGLDRPGASNFIRPLFNLTYGQLAGLEGAALYFNIAAIAACAGLLGVAASERQGSTAPAWLGLLVPVLPGFATGLYLLFVPCLAYDMLAAILSMLAYLAYRRQRFLLVLALLTLAVLTKETALPVIGAFAAHRSLQTRRDGASWSSSILSGALLILPILLWLLLRGLAFGEITRGSYTFEPEWRAVLRHVRHGLTHWPINIDVDPQAWPGRWLSLLNLMLAASCFGVITLRVRRGLDPAEWAFAASYVFLLLSGSAARYGASLQVFLLISLARWLGDARVRRLALVPMLLTLVGAGLSLRAAAVNWPAYAEGFERLHRIAQRYSQTLLSLGPEDRVVVLNDPTTRFARLEWMTQVLGVRARILKLSDFPWVPVGAGELRPCDVDLQPEVTAGAWRFEQSCGVQFATAVGYGAPAETVEWPGWVRLTRLPAAAGALPWTGFHMQLARADIHLLYYDPHLEDFRLIRAP